MSSGPTVNFAPVGALVRHRLRGGDSQDCGRTTTVENVMRAGKKWVLVLSLAVPVAGFAGSDTLDAAVGGAVGGAIGGAVGETVGGRDGAIIGAGVGAAAGVAVTTDDDGDGHHHDRDHDRGGDGYYHHDHGDYDGHRHRGHFCPPGQAKKGNC
ncbi:MAG: hypothetical protein AMXMBFR26_05750 [Porticoccaceae bacterium]